MSKRMFILSNTPRRIVAVKVEASDAHSVTIMEQSPNGKQVRTQIARTFNGRKVVFSTFAAARDALRSLYEEDRMTAHAAVVAAIQNIAAVGQLKEPA